MVKKGRITDIQISFSDNVPIKVLRDESTDEVNKWIDQAISEIENGNNLNLISFLPDEFELFSKSLM